MHGGLVCIVDQGVICIAHQIINTPRKDPLIINMCIAWVLSIRTGLHMHSGTGPHI